MFACSWEWCNPEGETEAPAERGGNGALSSSMSQRLKPSAGWGLGFAGCRDTHPRDRQGTKDGHRGRQVHRGDRW